MNMLMHGDRNARIERTTDYQYSFRSQFDFVITCIKRRETVWRGIQEAMELLGPEGKAALLIPDDILQKDQYEYERRELLRRHTIRAIVSLPASAAYGSATIASRPLTRMTRPTRQRLAS